MNRILTYFRSRFVSTTSTTSNNAYHRTECENEGKKKSSKFRALSLVAIPVIIGLSVLLVGYREEPKREPFVKYEYLRRRTKRFPWGEGERSLFHNPKYNALSDGYEVELDDECEEEEVGGEEGGD